MPKPFIVGLIGKICSGKETAADLVMDIAQPTSAEHFSTSGVVKDISKALGWSQSRTNLQKLAIGMKMAFGPDVIARALEKRIRKSRARIVIYDSIRWQSDLDLVRTFPHVIVYLTAPTRARWKRAKRRREKVGEGSITFKQFCIDDKRATETAITRLGKCADIEIPNTKGVKEFRKKVESMFREHIKPELRKSRRRN